MVTPRSLVRALARILSSGLIGLLIPLALAAQTRDVVSKQIGVGKSQSSLRLEFAQGKPLAITFDDGSIDLNGESVGHYEAGDALDTAWRALLGDAVSLDDGALAQRLRDWSPPSDVSSSEVDAARRVDSTLEDALSAAAANAPTAPAPPGPSADMDRAMRALVGRPRRLLELGRAVEDLDMSRVQVHVGENVKIADGQTVDASLVVVDGDLDVRGEIDGSVVMVGGTLRLEDGGRITDDVRLSDARIQRDGGTVQGDVSNVRVEPEVDRNKIRDEIRKELQTEMRGGRGVTSAFSHLTSSFGELIASVIAVLVIALLGGGAAVYFARERMEVVAEAARQAPLRAGVVGLAGTFLILPAWVVGALGLIVTIVGILALPFWIVLFPIAVCLAIGIGYLAIAQSVGGWVARQRFANLEWVRVSNPYTTVVAGVGALFLWLLVAHVIKLVGFLDFVSVLLHVFGVMLTCAVALIGFGAVLLTRGGRQPAYPDGGSAGGSDWGDAWDDDDLGFSGPARPSSPAPTEPSTPPAGAGAEPPDIP